MGLLRGGRLCQQPSADTAFFVAEVVCYFKELGGDNLNLTEAVEIYQEALASQADELSAEQDVAADAVETLELDDIEADADTELYDIEEVTNAVNETVEAREQDIRDSVVGPDVIGQDEAINAKSIALANEILVGLETVQQKQVNALKAKNPAVVSLQEKIAAYNSVGEEINDTVADYQGQATRFEALNGTGNAVAASSDLETAEFVVNVAAGSAAGTVTITFDDKGKVSYKAEDATTPNTENNKKVLKAFNELKGVDSLVASMEAVHGNIAKEAAAAKAVDAAILNALKKAGYKVYEEDTNTADTADVDSPAQWSDIKIENGEIISADSATTYIIAALDKDNQELEFDLSGVDAPYGQIVAAPDATAPATNTTIVDDMGLTATGTVAEATLDFSTAGSDYLNDIAGKSQTAIDELKDAKDNIKNFNDAVDAYNEALEAQAALKEAAKAVSEATETVEEVEELFEDLGYNLVKADDGVADGAIYNEDDEDQLPDLFVYGGSKLTVDNFDGSDVFYFGDAAVNFIAVDSLTGPLGGEANVLDIFAYQSGANTVLFVEKEAFAGNASGNATDNPDLVEITLTGVNAEDLVLNADGFLTLA